MIEVFPDGEAAAQAAATAIARALAEGASRGRASFVATGGRSPGPVYDLLREAQLDWARVSVTLSDERFVSPASPDSNERLVRERLLTGPASRAAFVPLWSPAATPAACADAAEPRVARMTPFDAVLLGMGDDGHIASLFPGSPALAQGLDPNSSRLCLGVAEAHGGPPYPRITLTLAALSQARTILILISGAAKRDQVDAALNGADLPVRALLGEGGPPTRILWST
jgi:6-phosphogluconolactonase